MTMSIGNSILIVGIIIGAGVLIWQFIRVSRFDRDDANDTYYNEVDDIEETIEETEEFIRRMERLS
ncbi:MAG: hypothetical protein WBC91_19855, partial [Phototrophicaceae bacterium]